MAGIGEIHGGFLRTRFGVCEIKSSPIRRIWAEKLTHMRILGIGEILIHKKNV